MTMPAYNKMKPVKKIQEQDCTCMLPFCDNATTLYAGPGQDLCDEHRMMLKEYGGLAVLDKPYSFHRSYICECCGMDAREQAKLCYQTMYPDEDWNVLAAKTKNEMYRSMLDVDHIDGDHDNNHPDNLRTLCKLCHSVKTTAEGDAVNRRYKKP